jgi:SWIM zinc finger
MPALTAEQVLALAPDASVGAAASRLSTRQPWHGLGRSEGALWGECQGGALYRTQVSLGDLGSACTCPSRKRPCKHALALMLLAAAGEVPEAPEPDWVNAWRSKHVHATERRSARAAARAARMIDPEAQARRRERRQQSIAAGLDGLEAWLDDLVRQGIARLGGESTAPWEAQARRLIDAQAPGLASRVRRMAWLPGAHPAWTEELLDRLGALALLVHAYRRKGELDPALERDVEQLVGHPLEQAEVVAHGDIAEDRWHVLGQVLDEDERMRMQRAWLRGERTGRTAVVLQFAAGSARFAESLAPGTAFAGALAFWPGALPRRALVHRRGPAQPIAAVHGASPIAGFLSDHAAALARMPWLESDLAALAQVVPVARDSEDGFRVADAAGSALPLGGRDHRLLFAVSGGHPIDVVGEWDGYRLRPLSAIADGRFHPLAGEDDSYDDGHDDG